MSVLAWRPRFLPAPQPPPPNRRIRLLPGGMELIDLGRQNPIWSRGTQSLMFHLAWRDVREIIAFKRDLYIVDQICVAFRTVDQPYYFIVTEEEEHWDDFCEALHREFGIDWPRCYAHIVQPPFATNRTTIWGTPWPLPCSNCDYDLRASDTMCPRCGGAIDPPSLLPADPVTQPRWY